MMYEVDDELATIIERLARTTPFENLNFNTALWKVIRTHVYPKQDGGPAADKDLDKMLAEVRANQRALGPRKAPTPSPSQWVATVLELRQFRHLTTWKAICDHLDIETLGDSARRKLKGWVAANKPEWPPVPDID